MKKIIVVLSLIFLPLFFVNSMNNDLSMKDIEARQTQSLWVRFVKYLFGKDVLEAHEQRTKEHRPDPYEW
jgi:hypothetical protein